MPQIILSPQSVKQSKRRMLKGALISSCLAPFFAQRCVSCLERSPVFACCHITFDSELYRAYGSYTFVYARSILLVTLAFLFFITWSY